MNTERPCGCKGIRTCLQCEREFKLDKPSLVGKLQNLEPWTFCPACERLYPGWNTREVCAQHPAHNGEQGLRFPGVVVKEHFLGEAEGDALMQQLDKLPWSTSQSGRRKQNYGPKTNFNKRKLRNGEFDGFPASTRFVQERLRSEELLQNFQTIEQCSLEYDPTKGASIDPHIDDCWIWGERVVTVNCRGDAVLTLTLFDATAWPRTKYNLDLVHDYVDDLRASLAGEDELAQFKNRVIRIPMPNLSLIVLYGPARYQYEHSVLREDINERRVCIAYREFTPTVIGRGACPCPCPCADAAIVTANAQNFWNNDKVLNVAK